MAAGRATAAGARGRAGGKGGGARPARPAHGRVDDVHVALRERVKELSCLYGISEVVARDGLSRDQVLREIVALLPPAWQYPEIAAARIVLDGRSYGTPGFRVGDRKQAADVMVGGARRGRVEVAYRARRPARDEGPFLTEERSLIDAVARKLALLVERWQAEEDRARLELQLRHADRLATIGQLAAGVAHELNEPLGNILGFTQLLQKVDGLPDQAERDVGKILSAALHAREIVRKLLFFARQKAPQTTQVDLNRLIEDGLYLFESRCAKAGIRLVRELAADLPPVTADSSQIHQVLVNLVVNAIQALPGGGTITLHTGAAAGAVRLVVEDTGTGMSPEVQKQIFIPFFTTKEVGQGTGLGLPVVHGIVTAHGGTIHVESTVGRGSRFEIRLPRAVVPAHQRSD